MRIFWKKIIIAAILTAVGTAGITININQVAAGTETEIIYKDNLENGWQDWSWNSQVQLASNDQKAEGNSAIKWQAGPWGAIYLHNDKTTETAGYKELTMKIWPEKAGIKLRILVYDQNSQLINPWHEVGEYSPLPAGQWSQVTIPTAKLGSNLIKGIALQEGQGVEMGRIWLDDIRLGGENSGEEIYQEGLGQGWENWSWNALIDTNNREWPASGTQAIKLKVQAPWGGLYLHTQGAIDIKSEDKLALSLRPSQDNQQWQILVMDENNAPAAGGINPEKYGEKLTAENWHRYEIPLSAWGREGKKLRGIIIQEGAGKEQSEVWVDEVEILRAGQLTSTVTSEPVLMPGYTVDKGKIYHNGQEIKLQGVNWFGGETDTHAVHGLWLRNWKEMISQIKQTGFNAVRLPICPAGLNGTNVSGIDTSLNPDLANLESREVWDKITNELEAQKIYYIFDLHSIDCRTISPLWYNSDYSEDKWINDLKTLAGRYAAREYFMGIDLKNEPHGEATWGTGNPATDWNTAAEKAGKAVLATNPKLLIWVEGVQNNPTCSGKEGHWQGGNLEPVKCQTISETSIPKQKLVLSPHVYGPDVWNQDYFKAADFPENMPSVWEQQFGYLTDLGYTIVPGEWGGKMGTNGGQANDLKLQEKLGAYLSSKQICSSFYWSWNPNSGDTGGILQDDWKSVWNEKMAVVNSYRQKCGVGN